jgi:hypothetical protein
MIRRKRVRLAFKGPVPVCPGPARPVRHESLGADRLIERVDHGGARKMAAHKVGLGFNISKICATIATRGQSPGRAVAVGAGKRRARDQRVSRQRAALIGT